MLLNAQAESIQNERNRLRLGPLTYSLIAHDAWGEQIIFAIDRYFPLSLADDRDVNRIIHLKRIRNQEKLSLSRKLPAPELHAIAPTAPKQGWQCQCNRMNTVWHSELTPHVFWTAPADDDDIGPLRFHLPWDLLLHDLAVLGGGLIHGGVAVSQGRAWLFLAPPGGGKTTTLATAPPDWQVPSDDAALIWPESDGQWRISPLPSWSTMLSLVSADRFAAPLPQASISLAGFLGLNKASEIHFERLSSAATAAMIYRSLNEYPVVIFVDHSHHERFFRCAARLARELPCWRLDLPLGGDIWSEFLPTREFGT